MAVILNVPQANDMPKDRSRQQWMRASIAAAAARLMAEDGIEDFALAKRKAARQLGATDTQALPGNDEIEAELRAYLALYQGDESRERLRFLRQTALDAMTVLEPFRPYLAGAVLNGTAGRYSEIDLQLFTDDAKAVEFFLLNHKIPYEIADERRVAGDRDRDVTVLRAEWDGVPINLAVFMANEERGVVRSAHGGRPIGRASVRAVAELLDQHG